MDRLVLSLELGTVQTRAGKVDTARKFKCTTAARFENLPSGGQYIISKMNGKSIKSNFNYKYRALMLICAIWVYFAGDLENSIHS